MPDSDLPATTTSEQNRHAASAREALALRASGQRRVNIVWEGTQALMALLLTAAEIFCAVNDINAKALDVAFGAVVTMYFIRTNHTRTGGVGGDDVSVNR